MTDLQKPLIFGYPMHVAYRYRSNTDPTSVQVVDRVAGTIPRIDGAETVMVARIDYGGGINPDAVSEVPYKLHEGKLWRPMLARIDWNHGLGPELPVTWSADEFAAVSLDRAAAKDLVGTNFRDSPLFEPASDRTPRWVSRWPGREPVVPFWANDWYGKSDQDSFDAVMAGKVNRIKVENILGHSQEIANRWARWVLQNELLEIGGVMHRRTLEPVYSVMPPYGFNAVLRTFEDQVRHAASRTVLRYDDVPDIEAFHACCQPFYDDRDRNRVNAPSVSGDIEVLASFPRLRADLVNAALTAQHLFTSIHSHPHSHPPTEIAHIASQANWQALSIDVLDSGTTGSDLFGLLEAFADLTRNMPIWPTFAGAFPYLGREAAMVCALGRLWAERAQEADIIDRMAL